MSKFQPFARNPDTLDGLSASFVIMDELHGVKSRNLYEVIRQSQSARRQPLMIMITPAGTERECISDDMYTYTASVADRAIATVWAYFRQLSGDKIYRVKPLATEEVLFRINYRSDIATSHIIKCKGYFVQYNPRRCLPGI